jgi:penicillin amidase
MRITKILLFSALVIMVGALGLSYLFLASSLPELDGDKSSVYLSAPGSIERDNLGAAVITAQSHSDAAFLIGYAHAQDRLFQMDLLRRSAAGELAELVGEKALTRDQKTRFYQFRARAQNIVDELPIEQRKLLEHYAQGVNAVIDEHNTPSFEFVLTDSRMQPWKPEDSILATFSMYIDLQSAQVERDFENTAIKNLFGQQMIDFMYQPSAYQSAIDFTVETAPKAEIPVLERSVSQALHQSILKQTPSSDTPFISYVEPQDIGSNNWAVSGSLTDTQSAMLSSDMHLGLQVPIIWYRAHLNYQEANKQVSVSGVSLPGTPLIIAGSTNHIAWGFTNSNVDNVDWVKLDAQTPTRMLSENILVKDATTQHYTVEMSEFGPVRELNGEKYALSWVAFMPYAVNMYASKLPLQENVEEALRLAKKIAIPVQNMVVADARGNIAWQLTGAISARTTPSLSAIAQSEYDPAWRHQEASPAYVLNPDVERVWSANARVVGTKDLARYGDGGYALGARQRQIADLLLETDQFDEQAFNQIQLDNRALFLSPWHNLLKQTLNNNPQKFANDIKLLNDWQACACADSIAYTLVRRFRSTVIEQLMQPIADQLKLSNVELRQSMRLIESGIWQLLQEKPQSWLAPEYDNYTAFLIASYAATKQNLIDLHDADAKTLAGLEWGKVNALQITHPFANSLGPLARFINLPVVESFGDSFMPAVQGQSFGASQRLIVRPGDLDNAILTVPGGQSMHPLSDFFRAGFDEYAAGGNTPLLPQQIQHTLRFTPTL